MDWQPTASIEALRARAKMLKVLADFFAQRQVMVCETPVLSSHTVTDVHLHSLAVCEGDQHVGYLQTSPEYMMKRLLAAGSGCIYQISKAFRAGECGRWHQPEFTMLEWYRVGFDMVALIDEVIDLVQAFVKTNSVVRLKYADIFEQAFALCPLRQDLLSWQQVVRVHLPAAPMPDDQDDCLDMLMAQVVAPTWSSSRLTCVYDFPASQAALARLDPSDDRVAKRFEIYVGAVELANGYHELTDPNEQQARMVKDNRRREAKGLDPVALDDHLVAALCHGLPDCAGVALGLDRLLMLHLGEDRLDKVVAFAS